MYVFTGQYWEMHEKNAHAEYALTSLQTSSMIKTSVM